LLAEKGMVKIKEALLQFFEALLLGFAFWDKRIAFFSQVKAEQPLFRGQAFNAAAQEKEGKEKQCREQVPVHERKAAWKGF